jgi:hypothetical protein
LKGLALVTVMPNAMGSPAIINQLLQVTFVLAHSSDADFMQL